MSDTVPRTERLHLRRMAGSGGPAGTDRLVAGTDRLRARAEGGTDKFRADDATAAVLALDPGTFIAGRYRVEVGPLAGGNAELYRCTDAESDEEVAVKLYRGRAPAHPEASARLRGLAHPNIVALHDIGTWGGWAYEAMEFCAGGSLAENLPLAEDAVRGLLPGLLAGLEFLHAAGIVHRDVKPSNILFRSPERRQPVLADFDISSLLEPDHPIVRSTESGANSTIDYAAPELFEHDQIGFKTDYYALGLTIAHALTGRSPFEGRRREQVVAAHLRGTIPLGDELCAEMRTLIRGLTDHSPENRWGAPQVRAWLAGETVRADEGRPWQPSSARPVPYPGFPAARTPRELSAHLDAFDAEGELFRTDDIARWVFDHFDAELARRIRDLSETFARDRRLGLFKLRFLLDPTLPLEIAGRGVRSLSDLAELLDAENSGTRQQATRLLFDRRLECWIDAVRPVADSEALLAKLTELRERLRDDDYELATFALLHTLDPARPIEFAPGATATSPGEIAAALAQAPEARRASLEALVFSGKLEEWLRAAEFDDWEADAAFVADCRARHGDERELACFGVLCRFRPDLTFPFGRVRAAEPRELARLVDRNPRSRKLGIDLLRRGWVRLWLLGTGRIADRAPLDRVLGESGVSWESKLEAVLQLLDPELRRPKAVAVPAALDLGAIPLGNRRSVTVRIDNATRGHLAGEAHVARGSRGVKLENATFEGAGGKLRLTVDPAGVPVGARQRAEVCVTSNGGALTVPVSYRVSAPLGSMLGRSLGVGALIAAVLGLLRALVATGPEARGLGLDRWADFGDLYDRVFDGKIADAEWALLALGLALLGLLAGYGYYLLRGMLHHG